MRRRVPPAWKTTLLKGRDRLGAAGRVIFVGIWMFAMRKFADKTGHGRWQPSMNLQRNKGQVYSGSQLSVSRFDDVAAWMGGQSELKEVVGFLKDPKSYGRLGGRVP